jgi:hypothetical protein
LHDVLGEDMINDGGEYMYEGGGRAYQHRRSKFKRDHYHWERRMRIEIPKFQKILQPEELLKWLGFGVERRFG